MDSVKSPPAGEFSNTKTIDIRTGSQHNATLNHGASYHALGNEVIDASEARMASALPGSTQRFPKTVSQRTETDNYSYRASPNHTADPHGDVNAYRIRNLTLIARVACNRFSQYGNTDYLQVAIEICQLALKCQVPTNQKLMVMDIISATLLDRYKLHGRVQDLERAIWHAGEAIQHRPPGHPGRLLTLDLLGNCRLAQYQRTGIIKHLEAAISIHREVLAFYPPGRPEISAAMINLAMCLRTKYEREGGVQHLEEAIQHCRKAMSLCPPGDPARLIVLNGLANCLGTKHEQYGGIEYLEEATRCCREGLRLAPPGMPGRLSILNNLSNCLTRQYDAHGGIEHLEEAIRHNREAISLCPRGYPERLTYLNNLANSLYSHYKQQGISQYLDEAVQHFREALLLCHLDHPSRSMTLSNLANALEKQYTQQGGGHRLEEAIQHLREALRLRHLRDPSRFMSLNNLANCLSHQYREQHQFIQLAEATLCFRKALLLCPIGHSTRSSSLNNLALCLHDLYGQLHEPWCLEVAVKYHREALVLRPLGHPDRPMTLNNLATCLHDLYREQQGGVELEEVIQYHREALSLRPSGHPDRSMSLNNLANCLKDQYWKYGGVQHLDEAIRLYHQSIQNYPLSHPRLANTWTDLALLYAENTGVLGGSHNVQEFSSLFEKAANHTTASISTRFKSSLQWIRWQNGPSALLAYEKCLELADLYLLIRPSITSRHQLIQSIPQTLASDAAACAIEAGDVKKAVEFLEQGRTLLLSQMARYRTQLDALQEVNPELAKEFSRLSEQLELSATSSAKVELPWSSMEKEASKYRQVSEKWHAIVDRIHGLDGFSTFLKAPRYGSLQLASEKGPIVIINISSQRSDAIIVQRNGDPILVPLPRARRSDVAVISSKFLETIKATQANTREGGGRSARKTIIEILRSLWDDVVQFIAAKFKEINIPEGSRIWWCPTSRLSMLPLHAAGRYRRNMPNFIDMYTSSYTPTLSALLRSHRHASGQSHKQAKFPHFLLVAQPESPGQSKLLNVYEEVRRVVKLIPSTKVMLGDAGTHDTVLAGLQTHSWVHLASHGSQNSQDPFKSCFLLHDKPLTLLEIIEAHLPDAQFAFLSACHSAAGDRNRPDESIHLAASLQFSGFQSVIGTMYAMADVDGPIVAEEVYKHMVHRGRKGMEKSTELVMDCKDAAGALHNATKVLRNNGVPLERWINFVHIGA